MKLSENEITAVWVAGGFSLLIILVIGWLIVTQSASRTKNEGDSEKDGDGKKPTKSSTAKKGLVFKILIGISLTMILVAVIGVKELQQGATTLLSLRTTDLAFLLGLVFTGLSVWWFNLEKDSLTNKVWGWVTAIIAFILFTICLSKFTLPLWDQLVGWWSGNTPTISKTTITEKVWSSQQLFSYFVENWPWMLLVVVVILIFLCIFKNTQKWASGILGAMFLLALAIGGFILLVGFAGEIFTPTIRAASGYHEEKSEKQIHAVTYTVSADDYAVIEWPSTYNMREFDLGPTGQRPTDLICWQQNDEPKDGDPYTIIGKRERLHLPYGRTKIWVLADTDKGDAWTLKVLYWKK